MLPRDESKRLIVQVVCLCLGWFVVSSLNSIIGKVTLNVFPYPMTVTMIQLCSIFVYLRPTLKYLNVKRTELHIGRRYYLRMIIPLAFAKFLASVSSHISLWKVPVSYSHTVKSMMPLFVVILSRVILGEKQSFNIYMSLIPIVLGVIVATATELSFDLMGLVFALVSIFIFSLMNIFSKKVLKEIPGLHHLTLLYVLSKFSLMLFLPVWIYFDFLTIIPHIHTVPMHVWVFLFLDGFCNFLQNLIAFTLLSLVTSLSYSVCNCTKRISIIISSLITLRNPITLTNILGMSMAVLGVFFYNKVKYEENQRTKLPIKIGPDNNTIKYENPLYRNPMLRVNGYTTLSNASAKTNEHSNGYANGYANGYTNHAYSNGHTYVNIY